MFRAHVFISGDVIGVGFRAWVLRQAIKRNLNGWIKNVYPDVEAVFEGKREMIDEIVALCHKGPDVGFVEEIRVKWEDYKGEFERFEIVR